MRNMWDNYNRIDPGQTGGPPNMWDITGPQGQSPAYDPYEDIGAMPAHPQFDETKNPQLRGIEDTSMDFLDLLDPTMLGKAGKFIGRHALEGLAGLPAAAGMIRMGGKEFPNAYLHRAIGDPKELDWWSKLFQKGMSSQKPTSAVTPSVLQTFQSEPFGLMFNVNDPSQLKHAAAADVSSGRQISWPEDVEARMQDVVGRIMDTWWKRKGSLPSSPQDVGIARRYSDAVSAAKRKVLGEGPPLEKWSPMTAEDYLLDPQREGLDRLLQKQLEQTISLGNPESSRLWHSELIPEIDRSMLAGVRLPLPKVKPNGGWETGNEDSVRLVKSLLEFANDMDVPVFRWPAVSNRGQQIKGLQEPFSGSWMRMQPRSDYGSDYITSSMLPKIFGITELP